MSDLVEFEDLNLLDGGDLRAVFDHVPDSQVLEALGGAPLGLRYHLLTKLPMSRATRLEAQLDAIGPVADHVAQVAQRAVVAALCHLSRSGQVAFDDPADMVA